MKNHTKIINNIIVLFCILVLWQAYIYTFNVNELILPPPIKVFSALIYLFKDVSFLQDVLITFVRTMLAFFIALVFSIPLGLFFGLLENVYKSFEFIIEFYRSIPATALLPMFLLFFGIGEYSKILLASWTAGLNLLINTLYGVKHRKIVREQTAKTLNITGFNYLKKIVLPEAMPSIFGGIRIAISLSLIIIVLTEIFHGGNGLGSRLINAQLTYNVPELISIIIVIGFIGYLFNILAIFVEKKIIYWKGH